MADLAENQNNQSQPLPGTPPQPPYSPVTPVMSQQNPLPPPPDETLLGPPSSTSFMGQPPSQTPQQVSQPPVFAPEPSPVPISESDNPDAIALRSALSILQMQRQQAMSDIRKLDGLKEAAERDPEGFSREAVAGRLRSKTDILHPATDADDEQDDDEQTGTGTGEEVEGDDQTSRSQSENKRQFGEIPAPQNVVRMPAINWAKYHIVGDALDRMHEEQRRRPTTGEPRRDTQATAAPGRNPGHTVAAPYRPFVDKLEPRAPTRGAAKRKHEQT